MTILLVPNFTKPPVAQIAAEATRILHEEGVRVIMDVQHCGKVPFGAMEYLPETQAYANCDLVVTIGGDGTMLHTARQTIQHQKPLIGINMGRIGFLTIVEQDELEKLRRLPRREYLLENRGVVQAECGGDAPFTGFALNDIVLFKQSPSKTIALDIYCDDIKVSSFRGDGIVFSTPTGSTAYSMSAGGPILDAQLNGIIATQICAHIVHTPPMVFAADRVLRAVPQGGEERIYITCDGEESQLLPLGEPIIIRQAAQTLPMIEFFDAGQLKSIDKKLKGR